MREREEPMTQTVKASEVRTQWSRLVNQVFSGKKRVLVEKSGIPVVAIVSARDLERLQRLEVQRQEDFKALDASWKAFEDAPLDDMDEQVAKAVADARAELRKESKQHAARP
jgi:prevent-host-death family protein